MVFVSCKAVISLQRKDCADFNNESDSVHASPANLPVVTKLVPASRSKSPNFLVCSRQLDFMKWLNAF